MRLYCNRHDSIFKPVLVIWWNNPSALSTIGFARLDCGKITSFGSSCPDALHAYFGDRLSQRLCQIFEESLSVFPTTSNWQEKDHLTTYLNPSLFGGYDAYVAYYSGDEYWL
jgi:hypothetical protein